MLHSTLLQQWICTNLVFREASFNADMKRAFEQEDTFCVLNSEIEHALVEDAGDLDVLATAVECDLEEMLARVYAWYNDRWNHAPGYVRPATLTALCSAVEAKIGDVADDLAQQIQQAANPTHNVVG